MTSIKYCLTITLKPKMYLYESEIQYDRTYMYIVNRLNCAIGNGKLTMIAELTKNSNIHYHSVITHSIKDGRYIGKIINDIFRRDEFVGFVNIKPLDNENGWIDYISKSFDQFYIDNDRRPIIIDQFNYFSLKVMMQYGLKLE